MSPMAQLPVLPGGSVAPLSALATAMVARQKIALGRLRRHRTVAVTVLDTTLAIDLDGDVKVVRRTNSQPVLVLRI
jgi:hypothetical protein